MPSLRAQLVSHYLRSTFKRLPLVEMEPAVLRARLEARALPLRRKGVERRDIEAPVRGEWIIPQSSTPGATILYLHGGGYIFGSPRMYRPLTFGLARASNAPVFALDYRLAPENPCPAAIEDALSAFDYLQAQGISSREIVVGGDSAGGGLAIALVQALGKAGRELPRGVFLYSPWTDLAARGASIDLNERSDAFFTADTIRRGGEKYAGDLPLDDPRVSPLYGEFGGFPRTLIFASDNEILRDDSVRVADRMREAGVDVDFRLEKGLAHVWPLFVSLMPESAKSIGVTARFIRGEGRK